MLSTGIYLTGLTKTKAMTARRRDVHWIKATG